MKSSTDSDVLKIQEHERKEEILNLHSSFIRGKEKMPSLYFVVNLCTNNLLIKGQTGWPTLYLAGYIILLFGSDQVSTNDSPHYAAPPIACSGRVRPNPSLA